MKHVFTWVGLGLALLFVAVFFTGRLDSKHFSAVASRVGMEPHDLDSMAPRIASQTGATIGTSRRVIYLLACSGVPDRKTMEAHAVRAAAITESERLSARQAAAKVLTGNQDTESPAFRDC